MESKGTNKDTIHSWNSEKILYVIEYNMESKGTNMMREGGRERERERERTHINSAETPCLSTLLGSGQTTWYGPCIISLPQIFWV